MLHRICCFIYMYNFTSNNVECLNYVTCIFMGEKNSKLQFGSLIKSEVIYL